MLYQVSVSFKNKENLPHVFNTEIFSLAEILNYIRQNFKVAVQSVIITKIDSNIYECVNCNWQGLDSDKKKDCIRYFCKSDLLSKM